MTDDRPRLILICGLPGVGKTTLARKLEAELPAFRLCGDEWMAQLGFDPHDEPARDRIEALFWQLARRVLARGQSVILESGFWLKSDRDEKRAGAGALGVAVELHWLDVPLDERWRRVERRNAQAAFGAVPITREQLAGWDVFFDAPAAEELALFDPPTVAGLSCAPS